MGQRTQIIVVKENNKGERQVEVYHHQWGYGRNMYLAFMKCVIEDYNKDTWKDGYDFFKEHGINSDKWYNVTDEVSKDSLGNINLDDIDTVGNIFCECDNNNGGMVIFVKENERSSHPSDYKIGFLLGDEDCFNPFAEWASPQEYGEYNRGSDYSDAEFVEMFDKFCKYFEVEYF